MKIYSLIGATALALCACSPTPAASTDVPAPATDTSETAGPERGTLEWAAAGDWRSDEEKARDIWRNPVETLAFFEVDNTETVVEIWPGGGWYTNILAPYLKEGGGRLIAAGFDVAAMPEDRRARIEEYIAKFNATYGGNPELYGTIENAAFSDQSDPFAPLESVDTVLTFRNVHNWMSNDYTAKFFLDAYAALKPGGILGVVEHRLASSEAQDPRAKNGYVHEDFVKALAVAAGFEFVAASDINANPADTKDHPFGVWTLPPNSRTTDFEGNAVEGFDPEIYAAIGESDRMTLKFRKPALEPADTGTLDTESEPVE